LKDGFTAELDARYKALSEVKTHLEKILAQPIGEDDLTLGS